MITGTPGAAVGCSGSEDGTKRSGADLEGKASLVWMRRAAGAALQERGRRIATITKAALMMVGIFVGRALGRNSAEIVMVDLRIILFYPRCSVWSVVLSRRGHAAAAAAAAAAGNNSPEQGSCISKDNGNGAVIAAGHDEGRRLLHLRCIK